MHEPYLTSFLQGKSPDHRGRFHRDIIAFSNKELEQYHDYIQWIFPLTEKSVAMSWTPILEDVEVIQQLRADRAVLENMRAALRGMQRFYAETDHWLRRNNHNHLRIARILKSAVLLGLTEEAEHFYTFILHRLGDSQSVTDESLEFWRNSIAK